MNSLKKLLFSNSLDDTKKNWNKIREKYAKEQHNFVVGDPGAGKTDAS